MARILTVTFNPSVDRATRTGRLQPTVKMRCEAPTVYPGGGGLNVARMLTRLGGLDVLALHTAAGLTGALLGQLLQREGVAARAIEVTGLTRDNLSVVEQASGDEYRFVMPGPTLAEDDVRACMQAVQEAASRPLADWVVFSGSLPQGMPVDIYDQLGRRLKAMGCRIALDSAGPALTAGLRACVSLVKPSLDELREATGKPLATLADQSEAAQAWIRLRTSEIVVVSLGADGALLATRDGAWRVPGLPVEVVGTTGAGDSLLAAMVWCLSRGQHPREAVRWGVAAGTAAVMREASALGSRKDIEQLLASVPAPLPC